MSIYPYFYSAGIEGTSGNVSTGGGGGGGQAYQGGYGPSANLSPAGGSGVVIISHPILAPERPFSTVTTGSPNVYISGGNVIYRFWQSGSLSF